jgi:flagellar biosynthesis repressor protein FlbT
MGLKLELKPGEKLVINGAVITVGRSGASLVLNNKATLLRGRDVMQAEEANTPVKRLYFNIMLMYIDPERMTEHRALFETFLGDLVEAAHTKATKQTLAAIKEHVEDGDFYRGMKLCRQLIQHEASLLSGVMETV